MENYYKKKRFSLISWAMSYNKVPIIIKEKTHIIEIMTKFKSELRSKKYLA